ncbi:MAG: amidohydrolase [Atopobiaceae bacterium]|jgi:predicted amidohydrolase YtcJ|nr:amidohydrolase [Atopobiaceae bacterium]MCI2173072.1 amidohydrolase [Atopobiaceae bacterium]MCI2208165.1 amidohydrolase [Atopobiaceae bacterium]
MKTLYHNGDFVPMTGETDTFEALVVADDGTIAFTGSLDEARAMAAGAEEVDLGGRTMLPSFIDPHSHMSGTIQYLTTVDLSFCESFADIVSAMRSFISERGIDEDGIVMGTGYDQNSLAEQRHPDRELLDQVSTTIPVIAIHASAHMGAGNGLALKLAGIDESTPDPEGGRYGRDADGRLTGYAEEPAALFPLYGIAQPRMHMDVPAMWPEMQRFYLEQGVTTCQDGATQEEYCSMFAGFAKAGMVKLDIVSYPMYGKDVDGMLADNSEFVGQDYVNHFRIGGLKMFVDGSPQGRTAWMTEPYLPSPDDPRTDFCAQGTMTDEEALDFALKALDGNRQLLCHCNGDAAADQYIRIYKEALAKTTNPDAGKLRPVMIHCQCVRKDQFEEMAKINMIPSIFVSHVWYWGDVHLRNFGPVRGGRVSAVHDALEAGLPYTFHSDTPVLRPNALESVWCAVNRKTKGGAQLDVDQEVSVYDALKAVTVNGAFQYGEEARKGTLEAGKLADLVILDKNPLKVDKWDIRNVHVDTTIKEGEVLFER